ncbi:aldolase [Bacillus sp. ISL-40]|uniref:aldolase n=1 Tax=unclassified Bacillus (in: firmicutes) TaxID=185979 RepID=UPI001BEB0D7F|nr:MULTISPECIES: aldolase [unclassified Bacillus (in: firmicutes)]MBT2699473.1 aldolase [Bacillus sp. ISL-40]MBT2722004.1 aldolase [Bacillus sp. ISL-46]MBT2741648.1 aldolase [Bacillus sp. ISL-77]
MITTLNTLMYKGFGLNILSEIYLPELPRISESIHKVEIVIEIDDLSKQWSEIDTIAQKRFVVKENKVMFEVPNTAIFSIQEGKKISVSPMVGVEEDKIRLYILGTCMGAILIQRKLLPLHGSAVAINGKAYAFVGDSGAGKSTLAAALIKEGYQLLSDDVIPVYLSKDNIPYVEPSYPHQKLWQESLNEFGISSSGYRPLFDRETKYAIPVHSDYSSESLPLAGVYELVKTESNHVEIRRIEGLGRFQTIYQHTYRNFLIPRLEMQEWHFKESAKILNRIEMYQLMRPHSGFTAHSLVSLVLSTIKEEEKV